MRLRPEKIRTGGFTLIELLVVMAIIGILMAFLLVAAGGGIRRAEEKATLALVTKLDIGIAERIEAILLRRADIAQSHVDLATIYPTGTLPILAPQRAQAIAQFDLFKAELPDVFFVRIPPATPPAAGVYPFNFAAPDYQGLTLLPSSGRPANFPNGVPLGSIYGIVGTNTTIGMYGATYQAAGALNKGLGYLPQGYDGTDNNGDGFIDDLFEGTGMGTIPNVVDPSNPSGGQIPLSSLIAKRLNAHTHNTARSEMLYALLVEGVGPLGSVFSRDEFNNREVGDTDGDGLLEFIDAWGQPLQFYRWPIAYNFETSGSPGSTYIQKGGLPYKGLSEVRQVDPLDPNQFMVSISWWANGVNSSPPGALMPYQNGFYSAGAGAFMIHFHSLLDPHFPTPTPPYPDYCWDRSGAFARRAYFSRYLILSSGPDKTPGVNAPQNFVNITQLIGTPALAFLNGENSALITVSDASSDDITNQGLASPGGGVR